MSAKLKAVDAEQLLELASVGCTPEEVYTFLELDTPYEDFCEYFHKHFTTGKARLRILIRRAIMRKAISGDTQMILFLSNRYLKDTDDGNLVEQPKAEISDTEINEALSNVTNIKRKRAVP